MLLRSLHPSINLQGFPKASSEWCLGQLQCKAMCILQISESVKQTCCRLAFKGGEKRAACQQPVTASTQGSTHFETLWKPKSKLPSSLAESQASTTRRSLVDILCYGKVYGGALRVAKRI